MPAHHTHAMLAANVASIVPAYPPPPSSISTGKLHAEWTQALTLSPNARLRALRRLVYAINPILDTGSCTPIPAQLVPLYLDLALSFAFLGEFDHANIAFSVAARSQPDSAFAWFGLGLVDALLGDWEHAIKSWGSCRRRVSRQGGQSEAVTYDLCQGGVVESEDLSTGEHRIGSTWALHLCMVDWNISVAEREVAFTQQDAVAGHLNEANYGLYGIPAGLQFGPQWTLDLTASGAEKLPMFSSPISGMDENLQKGREEGRSGRQGAIRTQASLLEQWLDTQQLQLNTRVLSVVGDGSGLSQNLKKRSRQQQIDKPKESQILVSHDHEEWRARDLRADGIRISPQTGARHGTDKLRNLINNDSLRKGVMHEEQKPRRSIENNVAQTVAMHDVEKPQKSIKKSRTFPGWDKPLFLPINVSARPHRAHTLDGKKHARKLSHEEVGERILHNLKDEGLLHPSRTPPKSARKLSQDGVDSKTIQHFRDDGLLKQPGTSPPKSMHIAMPSLSLHKALRPRKSSWSLRMLSLSSSDQTIDNRKSNDISAPVPQQGSSSKHPATTSKERKLSISTKEGVSYEHVERAVRKPKSQGSIFSWHEEHRRRQSRLESPLKPRASSMDKPLPSLPPDILNRVLQSHSRRISVDVPPVAEKITFYNNHSNGPSPMPELGQFPSPMLDSPDDSAIQSSPEVQPDAISSTEAMVMPGIRRANTDSLVTLSAFRWIVPPHLEEAILEEDQEEEAGPKKGEEDQYRDQEEEALSEEKKDTIDGVSIRMFRSQPIDIGENMDHWLYDIIGDSSSDDGHEDLDVQQSRQDELQPYDDSAISNEHDDSGYDEPNDTWVSLPSSPNDPRDSEHRDHDSERSCAREIDVKADPGGELLTSKRFEGVLPPRRSVIAEKDFAYAHSCFFSKRGSELNDVVHSRFCDECLDILNSFPGKDFSDITSPQLRRLHAPCFCQSREEGNEMQQPSPTDHSPKHQSQSEEQQADPEIKVEGEDEGKEKGKEKLLAADDFLQPPIPATPLPQYTMRQSKVYVTVDDLPGSPPIRYSRLHEEVFNFFDRTEIPVRFDDDRPEYEANVIEGHALPRIHVSEDDCPEPLLSPRMLEETDRSVTSPASRQKIQHTSSQMTDRVPSSSKASLSVPLLHPEDSALAKSRKTKRDSNTDDKVTMSTSPTTHNSNLYSEANEALYASIEDLLRHYHDGDMYRVDSGTPDQKQATDGHFLHHRSPQQEDNENDSRKANTHVTGTLLSARAYSGTRRKS